MKKGKLIVFSAPSGAGKTSIVRYLLDRPELNLAFSVSATSRQKRKNEKHGVDYYFIDRKSFEKDIEKGAFVEWEEVYPGSYYGTYKSEVEKKLAEGKNVIFDIDVVGGLNIKRLYPDDTLAIFIMPPSIEELEIRLRKRNTDDDSRIAERVRKAREELTYAKKFDARIVNDDLEKARTEAYRMVSEFINL